MLCPHGIWHPPAGAGQAFTVHPDTRIGVGSKLTGKPCTRWPQARKLQRWLRRHPAAQVLLPLQTRGGPLGDLDRVDAHASTGLPGTAMQELICQVYADHNFWCDGTVEEDPPTLTAGALAHIARSTDDYLQGVVRGAFFLQNYCGAARNHGVHKISEPCYRPLDHAKTASGQTRTCPLGKRAGKVDLATVVDAAAAMDSELAGRVLRRAQKRLTKRKPDQSPKPEARSPKRIRWCHEGLYWGRAAVHA